MGTCISTSGNGVAGKAGRRLIRPQDKSLISGSGLLGGAGLGCASGQLWQDRDIKWDEPMFSLRLRLGEHELQLWDNVEDTKGENGLGRLVLTNLRLVWVAKSNGNPTSNSRLHLGTSATKLNISIGLGNIAYVHYNMITSPTFGRVRAPHLMTQVNSARFEFTFAVRNEISMEIFTEIDNALRRYRATKVFRDLILRDEQLLKDGEVVILHGERAIATVQPCENLTADEKFPGVMVVTDQRVVWYSSRASGVNVSVPYVQFRAVGTRFSAFGTALVIETSTLAGGYILGFKFETQKTLTEMHSLLGRLHSERKAIPFFGPLDGSVQFVDDRLMVVPPLKGIDEGGCSSDGDDDDEAESRSTSAGDVQSSDLGRCPVAHTCDDDRGETTCVPACNLEGAELSAIGEGETLTISDGAAEGNLSPEPSVTSSGSTASGVDTASASCDDGQSVVCESSDEDCAHNDNSNESGVDLMRSGGAEREVSAELLVPLIEVSSRGGEGSAETTHRSQDLSSAAAAAAVLPSDISAVSGGRGLISHAAVQGEDRTSSEPGQRSARIATVSPASNNNKGARSWHRSGPDILNHDVVAVSERHSSSDATTASATSSTGILLPLRRSQQLLSVPSSPSPFAAAATSSQGAQGLGLLTPSFTALHCRPSPSSRKYRAPTCVVCMTKGTEAAFDPCGHLCTCFKCAELMKHCPICRGGVVKLLRVYLPTI